MSALLSSVLVVLGLWLPPLALASSHPERLRVEGLSEPLGLDVTQPRFSWTLVSDRRGAAQLAYQIRVASDPARLTAGEADLWDTNKMASTAHTHIRYGGKPLPPGQQAWWTVRIWDERDEVSGWSEPAHFSIGLLDAANWQAQWIEDPQAADEFGPANNGYHSQMVDSASAEKWVAVDLGSVVEIDGVALWPARPYDWVRDEPGFLFPKRFLIETATAANFHDAKLLPIPAAGAVANPGTNAWRLGFSPRRARYLRLRTQELRPRDADEFGLALAEFEVLAGGKNLALHAPATAGDSIDTNHWSVRALTDGDKVSHGPTGTESLTSPRLRKSFELSTDRRLVRATLHVTALGLYELFVNGRRIGEQLLAPEWTDYHTRLQYQTFDVTDSLQNGENVLAVQLGDGWYSGRIGLAWIVPGGPPRAIYGRKPKLLLQCDLRYSDGSVDRIVTDASWRTSTEGPWRAADLLDGVIYDAQREQPGWDRPGYDEEGWTAAQVSETLDIAIIGQANEPIRLTEERPALSRTQPKPGVFVYDFGQNLAGWVRVALNGPAGATVTLRHAEVLNPDGTIYTDNLRSAQQTDRYTLAGGRSQIFEPRFTYHGFRYVELTGLDTPPAPTELIACAVHSGPAVAGSFECSEALLNQLWSNVMWTQRANLHSTPTDCPQRDERLGWTGDILAFAPTACFNMDMAAFLDKWLQDMRDAQTKDGRYPDFAPHPFESRERFSGVPAWGDAGVFVAWDHYRFYGDKQLLATHYESARRWVDWIHAANSDLLWIHERHNDYGDWLNADTLQLEGWPRTGAGMPKDAFATAFFARSTQLVARMAQALGKTGDAARYGQLADDIRAAFNDAYVSADGKIAGDTQAGYAIALNFDLLPAELQERAVEHMIACFERYDGCISTGFHSTICLMRELSERGHVEEAYRLALNRRMPSWGYAIEHGATTVWERWDGYVEGRGFQNPGMNSFAHYAIGSVGEWLYSTVLGIQLQEPGFTHFAIRPQPGGGLTWARGAYTSIHGPIEVEWRIEREEILLITTVPIGTTATIRIPTNDAGSVRESGQTLASAAGLGHARLVPGGLEIEVAAGTYAFTAASPAGE